MASIGITFPAQVASFLNAYVPGFSEASGGSGTVVLQVPAFPALPSQVVAGLGDAGIQVPAAASSAPASGAAAPVAPVAAPAGAAVGLAQFAPAGLAPQGAALEDPSLAGAAAFAQSLSAQASSFFQQAASQGAPISQEQFATFAAQQSAALSDYLFGG